VYNRFTLKVSASVLTQARLHILGFAECEADCLQWLHMRFPGVLFWSVEAHCLRQGHHTLSSTAFSIHQDNEDLHYISDSIILKVDSTGVANSAMRVVGALGGSFCYGGKPGDGGYFPARLYHESVTPTSDLEVVKVAFFFSRTPPGHARRLLQHRPSGPHGWECVCECMI